MKQWSTLPKEKQLELLQRPAIADNNSLAASVTDIIDSVRTNGDSELKALTKKFDGVNLDDIAIPMCELESAESELTEAVKSAINIAYNNIRTFHSAQMPQDVYVETMPGVSCELKYAPIDSVGLYIPGGSAPLPSTVLMLGATAQVAGCSRKVLCTPPQSDGRISAEIRYAAKICEIDEIYLVGGAQAIAAMAFGTQSIQKVDKIFGPGNSYVTEAKQQVSKSASGAAIDMPAGPSEVLVLADSTSNPAFIAADLLSQAEHGADSQVVLVCEDKQIIEQTQIEIANQLPLLKRAEIARKSMQHARFIFTRNVDESIRVSNLYAPEHLIVQVEKPETRLQAIKNAGSIFVGPWSPESAGDYASGTNHVLPTYGYSRNYSSLGLADFMRRYTVQTLSKKGLTQLAPTIMDLAEAEGLDAHRRAVAIRLESNKG